MKKLAFIMLALTFMSGILTSCKKDKENDEPVAKEYTVKYLLAEFIWQISSQRVGHVGSFGVVGVSTH